MLEKVIELDHPEILAKEHCYLEVLETYHQPTILSIVKVNIKYELIRNKEFPKGGKVFLGNDKKLYQKMYTSTVVTNFNCKTGTLDEIAFYRGDYRDNKGRWAEHLIQEFSAEKLTDGQKIKAYHQAKTVYEELRKNSNFNLSEKEKEEKVRLQQAFQKIISNEYVQKTLPGRRQVRSDENDQQEQLPLFKDKKQP